MKDTKEGGLEKGQQGVTRMCYIHTWTNLWVKEIKGKLWHSRVKGSPLRILELSALSNPSLPPQDDTMYDSTPSPDIIFFISIYKIEKGFSDGGKRKYIISVNELDRNKISSPWKVRTPKMINFPNFKINICSIYYHIISNSMWYTQLLGHITVVTYYMLYAMYVIYDSMYMYHICVA